MARPERRRLQDEEGRLSEDKSREACVTFAAANSLKLVSQFGPTDVRFWLLLGGFVDLA